MPRWKGLPEELDPQLKEFAGQLRRLVDRSGLSVAAVADRTGYSRTSWDRYLGGRLLAPKGAVLALAEVTGADPEHLTTMWELAERAWSRSEMRQDMTMEALRIAQAREALGEREPEAGPAPVPAPPGPVPPGPAPEPVPPGSARGPVPPGSVPGPVPAGDAGARVGAGGRRAGYDGQNRGGRARRVSPTLPPRAGRRMPRSSRGCATVRPCRRTAPGPTAFRRTRGRRVRGRRVRVAGLGRGRGGGVV